MDSIERFNLFRFDGGAAGAAGAAGGQAGTNGTPGSSQLGNSGEAAGGQGSDPVAGDQGKTPEQREQEFQALIKGEYKDIYTKQTQEMINRRFKETRGLQEQLEAHRPLLDLLSSRYGITDGDVSKLQAAVEADESMWAEAAEEAGMTVEQYKRLQKAELENQRFRQQQRESLQNQLAQKQLSAWNQQAEELSREYEGFDLANEIKNPAFQAMLKAGVPMRNAYESIHMEDIKNGIISRTQKQTEKNVTDNIRAKGSRPSEVGGTPAMTISTDVSKLTKAQRAELARRAERGEIIKFS